MSQNALPSQLVTNQGILLKKKETFPAIGIDFIEELSCLLHLFYQKMLTF